ncbi:hypothetical protein [Candidatus Methylocalor cossyra]|uniref:DUF4189 domain-containing protein n=1 Tax=Candidatus Methylocalor cossyra TaxID=3108543 RepID=A0ABM9NEV8_9GAMM
MKRQSFALLAALAVFGVGIAHAKPDEVSEAAVKNCRYLGQVEGSSGYGKNFGWQPLAKADAERKADRIGATHIVWKDFEPVGAFNGEARAKAYACR